MVVKFKRLRTGAQVPTKATDGSNGFDLVACTKQKLYSFHDKALRYVEYGTGIAVEIPEGYCGLVLPRSSISNTSLILSNSVGLIDSDYRGEIIFRFKNDGTREAEYGLGDRLGQLLIIPVPSVTLLEVSELSETIRGHGGYGSTGK